MDTKTPCPECNGKKIIVGNCECNSEWRRMDDQDGMDDCICEPDNDCPTCKGVGFIEQSPKKTGVYLDSGSLYGTEEKT